MFGWCLDGKHDECKRSYRVFTVDHKGKVSYTGEERHCECPKRGCPCYVRAVDRTKTKTRRKK